MKSYRVTGPWSVFDDGCRYPALMDYGQTDHTSFVSESSDEAVYDVRATQSFFDSLPSSEFTIEDLNG